MTHCNLDPQQLSRFLEGTLPDSDREPVETHIASCSLCKQVAAEGVRPIPETVENDRSDTNALVVLWNRTASSRIPWRWAAALLLATGLGFSGVFLLYDQGATSAPSRVELTRIFESGQISVSTSETLPEERPLSTAADEQIDLQFPGGSHVRLAPETRAEWSRTRDGEIRLQLHAGTANAQIAPGENSFRVVTSAGDVRVLGTTFSVRVIDLPVPASSQGTVIELSEGRLELVHPSGTARMDGSQRGILVPGVKPYTLLPRPEQVSQQEIETVWTNLLRAFETKNQTETGFFTAILASHGDPVRPFLLAKRDEGSQKKIAAKLYTILGFER